MSGRQSPTYPHEGSIMFLPAEPLVSQYLDGDKLQPPAGAFNHPVVILSSIENTNKVAILILTSIGGKGLNRKPAELKRLYLPIHPTPPNPDSGLLLKLARGKTLGKLSYVATGQYYTVPYHILSPLRQSPGYTLDPASYALLRQKVYVQLLDRGIEPPMGPASLPAGHNYYQGPDTSLSSAEVGQPPFYYNQYHPYLQQHASMNWSCFEEYLPPYQYYYPGASTTYYGY